MMVTSLRSAWPVGKDALSWLVRTLGLGFATTLTARLPELLKPRSTLAHWRFACSLRMPAESMSEKVVRRRSPIHGNGVFAKVDFKA
ncbi:MAG: hypothetical protein ABIR16_01115, partial [Dokdonella sp.]